MNSSPELILFKQKRVHDLTAAFHTQESRLSSSLANNLRLVNTSRRLSNTQKQQQRTTLLNQYNGMVSNLKRQLSRNIALIQSFVPSQIRIENKKKALLIGINYTGTEHALRGCINDVLCIKDRLLQTGFQNQDIQMLTDTTPVRPTKSAILNAFKRFLSQAQSGDLLFFSYSGHGSYTFDRNRDETTLYDQTIIPIDLNMIVDDELKQIVQTNLKPNVTLFGMFDSCFSGTVLDLRYQYMDSLNYDEFTENNKVSETPGNVFMISGCNDYQTSADAIINNQANGAMTWSLLEALKQKPSSTWRELVKDMRDLLKASSFTQLPQISTGKFENIDTNVFI
jgi:metacaspase-1